MGKMTELLYAAAARSLTRWNAAPQPSAARPSGAPAQASSLPFKRKLLLEALEPRLLLSADLLPVNVPVVTAVVAASRPWMDARAAAGADPGGQLLFGPRRPARLGELRRQPGARSAAERGGHVRQPRLERVLRPPAGHRTRWRERR